jgi:RNA polymerase sigma-70 factor (ECF subfamily)
LRITVDDSKNQLDAELMRRIAQGDDRAFRTLYERLAPALFGMALRMVNDAAAAGDVLQEGFTYIWRKAPSFDSSSITCPRRSPARTTSFGLSTQKARSRSARAWSPLLNRD